MSVCGLFGFGMNITFLFLRKVERVSLSRVSFTNHRSSGLRGMYNALTSWYDMPDRPGAEPL